MRYQRWYNPVDDDPPEASRSQDRRTPLSPYPAAGPSAAELAAAKAILDGTEVGRPPRGRPNSTTERPAPMLSRR